MATKKDHALTAFMLVQQLDDEYWKLATEPQRPDEMHWDINDAGHIYQARYSIYVELREALQAARGGDVAPLVSWVTSRLTGRAVLEIHGILHVKDTLTTWDASKNEYVKTSKVPHVHILVRFKPQKAFDTSRTLANVADALGVEPQYIERPKKGRFAVDNMLAYLTHFKYTDKHQYAPEEVVSVVRDGGETYAEIYARRRFDWMRGRGEVAKKKASVEVDSLIEDILDGRITKQRILLTDELMKVYARNRSKIDDAFTVFSDSKARKVMEEMRLGKFKMTVVFVTGDSGNGKSCFADFFAMSLQEYAKKTAGEEWQVYNAAATNGIDAYGGEEILMLDDLRGASMRAEDWLKLLDNHRTSPISARYHNKTPICRTLIINSSKNPYQFFEGCARTSSEDLNQFIRRISAYAEVVKGMVGEVLDTARLSVGEVKKVAPYRYGYEETLLVYRLEEDNHEYTPLDAVKRLLGIIEKASVPSLSLYPEGWQTKIFEPLEDAPARPSVEPPDQTVLPL